MNGPRVRQQRNLLATLLLSQGTPMLLSGDEFGRTQRGNNNAYRQDNEISWVDWQNQDEGLLAFTRRLLRIRSRHPGLRRQKFFSGRSIRGGGIRDVMWFRQNGHLMTDEDWNNAHTQSLAMFLAGSGLDETDREGRPVWDDHLLLMMSASARLWTSSCPTCPVARWEVLLDTSADAVDEVRAPGDKTLLVAPSLKLFRCPLAAAAQPAAPPAP